MEQGDDDGSSHSDNGQNFVEFRRGEGENTCVAYNTENGPSIFEVGIAHSVGGAKGDDFQKSTNSVCDQGICAGFYFLACGAVNAKASLRDFPNDESTDGQQPRNAQKYHRIIKQQASCDKADDADFRENHEAAYHEGSREVYRPIVDFGKHAT